MKKILIMSTVAMVSFSLPAMAQTIKIQDSASQESTMQEQQGRVQNQAAAPDSQDMATKPRSQQRHKRAASRTSRRNQEEQQMTQSLNREQLQKAQQGMSTNGEQAS